MKILITGAAGFIGSEMIEFLLNFIKKKNNLIAIDDLSRGDINKLSKFKKNILFIKKDVKKINKLKLKNVDWIIHASAIAPLPDNQISHFSSIQENISQCGMIVDTCVKNGIRNILFLSSSAIYENHKSYPFKEDKVIQPTLMYPLSKYLSEKYFYSVSKSYNLNVVNLRLANVYGRNQSYERKQPPLLGYLIKNILLNKSSTLYAKGDFKRDYVFIDDLNQLVKKILFSNKFRSKKGIFEKINVGSGSLYSVLDFLKILEQITKKKILYKWGDKKKYWRKYNNLYKSKISLDTNLIKKEVEKKVKLDLSNVKKLYNWKANYTIDEGLKECIKYASKKLKIKFII